MDLFDYIQSLRDKYNKTPDPNNQIIEYESLIRKDPSCELYLWNELSDLYIKQGLNDRAWAYLNNLSLRPVDSFKVRLKQANILKKEKRSTDAIGMYMRAYLLKAQTIGEFQADMFKKDIKSSANRLKLDESKINHLVYLMEFQCNQNCFDEHIIIDLYAKTIKEFEL